MFKKIVFLSVSIVFALLISGCLMLFHPLYSDDTLISDNRILGTWSDEDGIKMTFTKPSEANKKLHLVYEQGEDKGYFEAHLVKLDGSVFLNLFPKPRLQGGFSFLDPRLDDLSAFHYFPMNTIFKLEMEADSLKMSLIDIETIGELIENKRVRIKHEINEDFGFLITAPTRELQQFVIQYKNHPDFFMDAWGLVRSNEE